MALPTGLIKAKDASNSQRGKRTPLLLLDALSHWSQGASLFYMLLLKTAVSFGFFYHKLISDW